MDHAQMTQKMQMELKQVDHHATMLLTASYFLGHRNNDAWLQRSLALSFMDLIDSLESEGVYRAGVWTATNLGARPGQAGWPAIRNIACNQAGIERCKSALSSVLGKGVSDPGCCMSLVKTVTQLHKHDATPSRVFRHEAKPYMPESLEIAAALIMSEYLVKRGTSESSILGNSVLRVLDIMQQTLDSTHPRRYIYRTALVMTINLADVPGMYLAAHRFELLRQFSSEKMEEAKQIAVGMMADDDTLKSMQDSIQKL